MGCRTAATTSNVIASPGHRSTAGARRALAGPWANRSSVGRRLVGGAVELAPAQDLAVAGPCAARAMARGHRGDVAEAGHHHGHVAGGGGAVAELAVLVGAPAPDRAVLQHGARVVRRAADRDHVAEALHLDRRIVIVPGPV